MEKLRMQEGFAIEEEIDLSVVDEILDKRELTIHNDDVNTFDWVIESLIEICGHTAIQAEQISLIVHYKGKACAKSGTFSKLKPMKDALIDRGINATVD